MLSSRKTLGAFFLIFALSFVGTALAQEKLTVEWIYSDAYAEIAAMPQVQWLENGNLLLLDNRVPKAERTLEMLQAGKWKRAPWVKREMALNSLQALLPADADSVKSLGWPAAISPNGENLAYLFEKDIYLLNAKTSLFSRLTKSEGEEKSLNFSPDGKKLAYVRDNDLYVYHLINSSEARLTKTGGETLLNGTLSWVYWEEIFGRRDIGYWWSGNSRQIAFLRSDESAVSKMFFVNQRPDIPELITQRYPKAGTENPTVHVGVVNASGEGEATWLELGDYEYIARVKWLPGDQKVGVQVLNRPQTELTLFLADPRTGKSEKIMTESDTAWVNINDDLYFLDNGKDFLWQSERSGFAHLYRFNMNGQLRNQITNGEWALRSSGGAYWLRQSVMAIDQKKEQVYFTGMKESSVQRHLYRVDFNGGNLTKISKEKGVHSIQFSPDARYYVDSYSHAGTMPTMSIHDRNGKKLLTLASPRNEMLAGFSLQTPELFTIPTSDGFPMPAEILKPRDFDPNKAYPLIYYVYGGPSAPTVLDSWRGSSLLMDNILLEQGYIVVRFDNRCSAAISKILENRLSKLMSGPTEIQDAVDGIRWLKAQPWVDAERVGIWGWSGGGSFTVNALTSTSEFKAGFAVAAVTDWRYYDTRWAEFAMKTPEQNPEGYKRTSYLSRAENLHGRLMLVHGTYDDNVHPQNLWNFVDELVKHNVMFDLMVYPMRKHGIADRPARIHLYNTMLEFWAENL